MYMYMISQHNLLNKILISMNIGPQEKFNSILVSLNFLSQILLPFIKVCFYNIYNEVLNINSNLISFWANLIFEGKMSYAFVVGG